MPLRQKHSASARCYQKEDGTHIRHLISTHLYIKNLYNVLWDSLKQQTERFFSLSDYLVTQAEAEASIREGVSFRGTNIVILVLAIFIASLGLNTNSTAVIIGAMLISPLMGPIIGLGLAVGIQDFALLRRSGRNLAAAAIFSILASAIYFLISPVAEGHSELLARTSPTIYDVLIGFFGGGAGIVALGSRSKGNVIPGVAIATALMPPLCTVGYGLATLQPHYFFGALYLFLINSVFIGLATFIGVKLMKYQPVKAADPARARRVQKWVYGVATLTLLPSIYLTYNMLRENRFDLNVDHFVDTECRWPETRVISVSKDWHSSQPSAITLTLVGATMPRDSLTAALASRLSYYHLDGTKNIHTPGRHGRPAAPRRGSGQRYACRHPEPPCLAAADHRLAPSRDSAARPRLGRRPSARGQGSVPPVRSLAVTRAVFADDNRSEAPSDTVNLALVNVHGHFTAADRRGCRISRGTPPRSRNICGRGAGFRSTLTAPHRNTARVYQNCLIEFGKYDTPSK